MFRLSLFLVLLISPTCFAEKIELKEDTFIDKPYVLNSRDIFEGNGYAIKPKNGFKGPAIIVTKENYVKIRDTTFRDLESVLSLTGNNYLEVNGCSFVDIAGTSITSLDNWDCKFESNHFLRNEKCIVFNGSEERPSNPLLIEDCHFESYAVNAIVVGDRVFNLQFVTCKFHGNIEKAPTGFSIVTPKNCPPMTFFGGLYMFNPKGHFSKDKKPKLSVIRPITDNPKTLGECNAVNPVTNDRVK